MIDKSAAPDRIFHEKSSDRWRMKSGLQAVGAPENPATSSRLKRKSKCAQVVSEGPFLVQPVEQTAGLNPNSKTQCDLKKGCCQAASSLQQLCNAACNPLILTG